MHGVGDPRAEQRRDPFALEEALHHDRLGAVAAVHGDETPVVRRLEPHTGKRDDLAAGGHALIIAVLARPCQTDRPWLRS